MKIMNLLQLISKNNLLKFSLVFITIFFISLNAQSEIPEKYKIESSLKKCKGTDYRKWNNCYGHYEFPRIEYKGEWKSGKMHGEGILREAWGDIYIGGFSNNLANGFGRQDFYIDGVYAGYFEGEIKDDFLNGEAEMVLFGDYKYKGQFKQSLFDGYGIMEWNDGSRYEGYFKKDLADGQGTQNYSDGSVYVGNFKESLRDGQGKMNYSDGNIYEGEWKEDNRDGFGSFTWANGDRYVGHFKNDVEYGAGMFKRDKEYFYEGGFEKGTFEGKGRMEWIDGEKYIGDFVDGNRNGVGTYYYESGTIYKGEFKNNIASGKGKVEYADGGIYEGEMLDDLENGFGIYTNPKGDIYSGQFKEGYFHGIGKMIYANGDIYDGLWEDGYEAEDKKTLAKFTTDEKYYALIIGNNDYKNLENLDNAVNDAKDLEKVLKEKYGFDTKLLLNKNKDETLDEIINFTRNAKKNDNLLIYYAGHGQLVKKQKRGYWLPTDSGQMLDSKWLSNNTIKDQIISSEAKHILLVVDSCFSGSLTRSSGTNKSVEKLTKATVDRLLSKKTRLVITSGGNEDVVDGIGSSKNSVFAEPLIRILKNNTDVIRSYELFKSVQTFVIDNADQTPNHSTIHGTGHDGGEFLFFPIS